jgi:hypothetical protein
MSTFERHDDSRPSELPLGVQTSIRGAMDDVYGTPT